MSAADGDPAHADRICCTGRYADQTAGRRPGRQAILPGIAWRRLFQRPHRRTWDTASAAARRIARRSDRGSLDALSARTPDPPSAPDASVVASEVWQRAPLVEIPPAARHRVVV